jgi:hypothetical protein
MSVLGTRSIFSICQRLAESERNSTFLPKSKMSKDKMPKFKLSTSKCFPYPNLKLLGYHLTSAVGTLPLRGSAVVDNSTVFFRHFIFRHFIFRHFIFRHFGIRRKKRRPNSQAPVATDPIQEPILRLLNLQLQRQSCSRLERFYSGGKSFSF